MTYNQMLNLSMTNPISSMQSRRSSAGQNFGGFSGQSRQQQPSLKKKNDYCWSFNRGHKCKFGKKCKFIERCSYCDSPYHGLVKCEKLDKKEKI